jgi:hypothetical protein
MGLLKLLAFPLSGPLWVAKVLADESERQLYDEDAIRGQIATLHEQHQAGEIDDATLAGQEETLFERLLDAREYHRQKRFEQQGRKDR